MQIESLQPLYIFPHAPRTGGDTINILLAEYYHKFEEIHFGEAYQAWMKLRNYQKEDFYRLKCLRGHGLYFGIHKYISRSCKYFQIFRDPVQQVISQYYMYLNDPRNGMHKYIVDNHISLDTFIEQNPNTQANYILGFPHEFNNRPSLADWPLIENILNEHFVWTGVTELYNESIFTLQQTLNFDRLVFWRYSRKNKLRPKLEEIPKETIEKIELLNQLDRKLHNYAKTRLTNQLQSLGLQKKQLLEHYIFSLNARKELHTALPKLTGPKFIDSILQKPSMEIALISLVPEASDFFANVLSSLCAVPGLKYSYRVIDAENAEVLEVRLSMSDNIQYLDTCDLIIASTAPGKDYLIKNPLIKMGINPRKIVFGLKPPPI